MVKEVSFFVSQFIVALFLYAAADKRHAACPTVGVIFPHAKPEVNQIHP
jgi:hypothetical protein